MESTKLWEAEGQEPSAADTQVCRCCKQRKPLTDYYFSGTRYQRRCKSCAAADRHLNKLIAECRKMGNDDYNDWPDALVDFVKQFAEWSINGGKIDYANSEAPGLVAIYAEHNPTLFANTRAASGIDYNQVRDALKQLPGITTEVTSAIDALIDDLSRLSIRVGLLEGKQLVAKKMKFDAVIGANVAKTYNPCLNPSGMDLQERKRLMDNIRNDQKLLETFGAEELQDLVNDLDTCFRTTIKQGYVDPYTMRKIVAVFEEYQTPMTDDMLIIYRKFIKPGLEAAMLRDDYADLVQVVKNITDINFYEEPWEAIPHIEYA